MKKPMRAYSVGVRLRQAREKRGWSQRELADKSEISASSIGYIESGEKQPRGDTVESLAIALEVDPCWLLYGTGTKPQWGEKSE